jgi:hypothetical protein
MKTEAWGWLVVGVLAAGLNASYHDGGMPWAHRAVNRMQHGSAAVVAMASGRTEEFLAEAKLAGGVDETPSCRISTAMAQMQSDFARSQAEWDRFEAVTDRQQAKLVRFDAKRARMEAEIARIQIPAVSMSTATFSSSRITICPRVRVNIPQAPRINMPAIPVVRIESSGNGPV